MHPASAALLFAAAVLAGALNSVAGGGSFIAFPALIFTGIAPVSANATNTVALWPGTLASARAYREDFGGMTRALFITLIVVGVVGGVSGATILLRTRPQTFVRLIPWLLLVATAIFAFGGKLANALRARNNAARHAPVLPLPLVIVLQLAAAIYGGFFGAGIGILMLAILSLTGLENIHSMNAYKNLLVGAINGVAVVTFITARIVAWPEAVLMVAGSIVGGWAGARVVRRFDPAKVRVLVIVIACAMTAYFFWKTGV
ncbi:MAG TPA: sulfite exporter TauE/SafE family protein [Terriglobales bacterium]|nr:sulfite exporter TauE/SafE family protein [Terriglobales bacterium]